MDNKNSNQGKPPIPNFNDNKNGKNKLWIFTIILGILAIVTLFYPFGSNPTSEMSFKELIPIIENQDVEKIVVVNGVRADIYIKLDKLNNYKVDKNGMFGIGANKGPHYFLKIGSFDSFEKKLDEIQKNVPIKDRINISSDTESNVWGGIIHWIILFGVFGVIWYFFIRKMSGGAGGNSGIFNIGKSKARVFDKEKRIKITFKDVAGLEEAKVEVMEIVDFLKNPKKYTNLGGKIPKGALLVGPPGTGKTLLAKAVAGEAEVPFFSLSGSDFVEMFVGVGASRVRDLFAQAKSKSPCIIFIDEIDAVALHRSFQSLRGDVSEIVNSLLTEMDGINENDSIITICATNNPSSLDYAIRSRFEEEIEFKLPDDEERLMIIENNLKTMPLDYNLDLEKIVKQTKGMSGRDIKEKILKTALHNAIATESDILTMKNIDYSIKSTKIKNKDVKGMFE